MNKVSKAILKKLFIYPYPRVIYIGLTKEKTEQIEKEVMNFLEILVKKKLIFWNSRQEGIYRIISAKTEVELTFLDLPTASGEICGTRADFVIADKDISDKDKNENIYPFLSSPPFHELYYHVLRELANVGVDFDSNDRIEFVD